MSKLKLFAGVAVGSMIFAFVLGSGKAAAATTDCGGSNWGINTGSSSSDAGLIVHAQLSNGTEVNVAYTLKDVDSSNQYAIWQLSTDGNGVNKTPLNSLKHATGDTYHGPSGSSYVCTGYDIYGYGSSSNRGNFYALDCHGVTSGGSYTTSTSHFQIQSVAAPSGHTSGYWNGDNTSFTVTNGSTKTVTLTWYDYPNETVSLAGNYSNNASLSLPTQAKATFTMNISNSGQGSAPNGDLYWQNQVNGGSWSAASAVASSYGALGPGGSVSKSTSYTDATAQKVCFRAYITTSSATGFDSAATKTKYSNTICYTWTAPAAPTCSLSASPSSMIAGNSTTISWSSTNATSMTVSGNGKSWSGTSGSQSDNPSSTVTYSGSVSGAGGSASCSTTVTVTQPPTCSISATPNPIVVGMSTTISWSSTNATSMTVSGNGKSWSGTSGTQADSPGSPPGSTYMGNVTGPGGSATCSTNVTVLLAPSCSPSSAFASPNQSVTLSVSGGNPALPYSWSGGGSPSSASGVGMTSFTTTFSSVGVYTVTVTNSTVSSSCTVDVINTPFFRIYAGDGLAGVGFAAADGSCSGTIANKRQLGFTSPNAPYAGAGSADANFATGPIVQFMSGLLGSGLNNPKAFAFANDAGSGTFGGNSAGNMGPACAPDSYDRKSSVSTSPLTSGSIAAPAASGNYTYTGNLTYTGGTLPTGVRATIFVNGNVYISSNTYYQNSGSGYGTDPSAIPQLKIVAKGNVYVAAGVTELNGIFVAQPIDATNGGSFYSCGFDRGSGNFTGPNVTSGTGSSVSPFVSSELTNTCNQQLTIYGAVVARDVHLLRTYGTVAGTETNGTTTTAGERFIYTPDTWFNGDPSSTKQVQSYSALPTIL